MSQGTKKPCLKRSSKMKPKDSYNKTQLHPETCLERHVFHRDQFAHVFRWTHVLKRAELGMNILDVGCGSGNCAELLYRNRYKATQYLGVDIRPQTVEANNQKFESIPWISFEVCDIVKAIPFFRPNTEESWDIIVCFEVFEHIGKYHGQALLDNIVGCMGSKTILLVSTPCYDAQVGAADNHIINGEIGEFTYYEFKILLETKLKIVNNFGTFASKKDYKKFIPTDLKPYFDRLNEYYDDNLISNLMAPLFPEHSRNVLWECKLK